MKLVGEAFPRDRFDLCYFRPSASAPNASAEIVRILEKSGGHGVFVVIGSEDPALNKEVAGRALPAFAPGRLSGSRIALLGAAADQVELGALVRSTGAEFLFVELPGATDGHPRGEGR